MMLIQLRCWINDLPATVFGNYTGTIKHSENLKDFHLKFVDLRFIVPWEYASMNLWAELLKGGVCLFVR